MSEINDFNPEKGMPDELKEFMENLNKRLEDREIVRNGQEEDEAAATGKMDPATVTEFPITVQMHDAMNGYVLIIGNRYYPSMGREFIATTLDEAFDIIKETYASRDSEE